MQWTAHLTRQWLIRWTAAWVAVIAAPALADEPPDLIHAVCFAHPDFGVLAGGQGKMWRTEDGGRRWQTLAAPTDGATIRSLQFLDLQEGWAAGGWTHPYTHRSTGVLLRTSDGGKTWRPISGLTAPQFREVHFFDRQQGWALVDPSPLYPNGLIWTRDGGRSWAAAPGDLPGGARLAAFVATDTVVAVDRQGQVVRVTLVESRTIGLPRTAGLQAMAATSRGGKLWLVGDAGMILHSRDQGATWRDCSLPRQIGRHYDLRAVWSDGQRCWTAGAPGTHVFVSDDEGGHWRLWATGQKLPIGSLQFIDGDRGWAGIALGGLLATRDGGASWQTVLPGGQRAVLLTVQTSSSEGSSTPWEAPAQLCAEQGYYAAWEFWEPREAALVQGAGPRLQEAAELMRAQPAQVLLPPMTLAHAAADGAAAMQERLVRSIRQWRPEVLLVVRGSQPSFGRRWEALRTAAQQAQDPAAYPDQLQAGLEPWQLKRVAVAGAADGSPVVISTGRLAAPLGQTLAQFARRARRLEQAHFVPEPDQIALTVVWNQAGSAPRRDDLLAGCVIAPGAAGRRSVDALGVLPDLHRRVQLRRNLDVLIDRTTTSVGDAQGVLLGQIDELTRDLPPEDAGDLLFQLAMAYGGHGQPEFAAELLWRMQDRQPQHALNEAALVWLLQYYCSSEYQWDRRAKTSAVTQASALEPPQAAPVSRAVFVEPLRGFPQQALTVPDSGGALNGFQEQTQRLLRLLQQTRPELLLDPRVQLPLAAKDRREGRLTQAQQVWRALARSGQADWSQCGQWELDLLNGPISPRKADYGCQLVDERPRLDGLLDEPMWNKAQLAVLNPLRDGGLAEAANVMLAYDQEFLYIAISAPLPPGKEHEPLPKQRYRDADLATRDHIELLLDIDRDYSTFYRLAVDQSGRTFDACHLDQGWDPQWFVAAHHDSQRWTVEAAIAWSDLARQPPHKGDVWLMGLQRHLPGDGGIQTWTTPASATWRPEGFGALRFD